MVLNWLRLPSAPSIPAPKQAFGYDETKSGELVMQKNPEKVFDGTKEDCVGPGHYEVRYPYDQGKGPTWGRSKGGRGLSPQPSTSPDIGPGSYNQLPGSLAPMYKFQQSAVFHSATKRPAFVPTAGKSVAETSTSEDFDVVEDGSIPGPGFYYDPQKMTEFRVKQVPERLQFFGSTAARFNYRHGGNRSVGPGSYSTASKTAPTVARQILKAPFASTDMRFPAGKEKVEATPGPGSYKDLQFMDDVKKKAWGRQGVFGTTEKRFAIVQQVESTPGPGYYPSDLDKRIGMHNSAHHKPLSVFQSKSKRTGEVIKLAGPAPGQYDVLSGFERRKGNVAVGNNPLVAGMGEVRRKEAGFDAKSQRFPVVSMSLDSLGPGAYNPKLPQDLHVENQKSVFLPQVLPT